MRLLRPTIARAIELGVVLAAVSALVLLLMRVAPGSPLTMLQADARASAAVRLAWAHSFDPSLSWGAQLAAYWQQLLSGQLGWSLSQQRPIADVLREVLPWSVLLVGSGLVLSAAIGAAVGMWLAVAAPTAAARWVLRALRLLSAVPDAWLALVLLLWLAVAWPLFPMQGVCDPRACGSAGPSWRDTADVLRHLALPLLTLTLLNLSRFARMQRMATQPMLASAPVRAAMARGVTRPALFWRYIARRTLLPWVTLVGLSLPTMLGGAVFVERVFGWPGAGRVLLQAIDARDYPLVMTMTLLAGALTVLGAWAADVAMLALDPRHRAT